MSCKVIIGTQWGDEGKAKIIDYFCRDTDIVVRYQGGGNAGHTVVADGVKHIFHLVPSGILHNGVTCVIGNGLVIDPELLMHEIVMLEKEGFDVKNFLRISDSAHLVLPYHKIIDEAMEEFRDKKIGTTKRGIGPCYADKSLRYGIRVGDLFDKEYITQRITNTLKIKNLQLEKIYSKNKLNLDEILNLVDKFRKRIDGMVTDTRFLLYNSLEKNKRVLLEGAQGNALDIDHGTYPYVTSSNPTIGGALAGTGLNPFDINEIVGIVKAYTTRVGEGPFPTEDNGDDGSKLREKGGEFGSTTGRPRRCGWFDVELLKYTKRLNGLTSLALTKLDVLNGFKKIRVSVGYSVNGKRLQHFPSQMLDKVEPIYEDIDGWEEDISSCRNYDELPENAKVYVRFIEEKVGVRISVVSVGPDRSETIVR